MGELEKAVKTARVLLDAMTAAYRGDGFCTEKLHELAAEILEPFGLGHRFHADTLEYEIVPRVAQKAA